MAKYGMSMCVLGMSEEFKSDGIAVNALWPQTGRCNTYCEQSDIRLIKVYALPSYDPSLKAEQCTFLWCFLWLKEEQNIAFEFPSIML